MNESGPSAAGSDQQPLKELLEGSYILMVGEDPELSRASHLTKSIGPHLTLSYPSTGGLRNWTELETETHHLLLDGYFYLQQSNTVAPKPNLKLLVELAVRDGIDAALTDIAGGLYNLFIYDKSEGRLVVRNDRLGILPLYIFAGESAVLFSNNAFNFQSRATVDTSAIYEFLKFGYLPVAPSLFKEVDRLAAWEILEVELDPLTMTRTPSAFPDYPGLVETAAEEGDLAFQWSNVLVRYFKRIQSKNVLVELDAGHDARLLLAHVNHLDPQVLNFGAHFSPDTAAARQVAKALEIIFWNDQHPTECIKDYNRRLPVEFRTLTSFESAHSLNLSQKVHKMKAEFLIDGSLGAAVLGNAAGEEWGKGDQGLFSRPDETARRREIAHYVDILYHQGGKALDDKQLAPYFGKPHREELRERFQRLVERVAPGCAGHADMLERLWLLTRGRHLACRQVVACQTYTQVLMPFSDDAIMDLSLRTPKGLRHAHRLYNTILRENYPTLAGIRTRGSYGRPSDAPAMYRLGRRLWQLIHDRIMPLAQRLMKQERQPQGQYIEVEDYVADLKNGVLFESLMVRGSRQLPQHVHGKLKKDFREGDLNPRILLRYGAVLKYLQAAL